MKLSCLKDNLSKGLAIVSRAVATRTTLPITNNVLLKAHKPNKLELAATNLEITMTCEVEAEVEESGSITIPARLLTEFVNSLPNEQVRMQLKPGTRSIEMHCARYEARINGMDANDFPPIPKISDGLSIKISPDALRLAIGQVVFAAASEDTRPVLTGVHADFNDEGLTLAAADGFRLAVHKLPLEEKPAEKVGLIIPGRSLNELNRLLSDQDEPVILTVNANKSQILFSLKKVQIVSQLIQGSFPNYKQLIPARFSTKATVVLADFLNAAKSASIFARDGSGIIRLQVVPGSPGKIMISAQAEELGDNIGEIDATVDGEPAKIAFNSKYLTDVLSVIKESQVELETTGSSSPGVIKPVGSDNYIHIVMPMFVQW
ncbi:MAG: DNA polymerase III subunit beta [Chloroflexi bacterium]|nr:DNA polymerase III subunit beta [Chloroflexota bacterium]